MDCGEKFPYALLSLSKKLIAGLILIISPLQILSRPIISHISYPTPTAPEPHTRHTHAPTLPPHPQSTKHHKSYPTTPPIPLLLRVDSDEMRQNRKVFAHEVLECSRASTKWTSTKWTPRGVANKARACSKSVYCERGRKRRWMRCTARRGRFRILPSLRRQSFRKPYNISENHTNSKKIT